MGSNCEAGPKFFSSTSTSTSPGAARQLVTFLASPRKVTKRRRTPIRHLFEVPCVARLARRLRNSHCVLKQSSPTTPDQSPLLGGGRGEGKAKNQNQSQKRSSCLGTLCPNGFLFLILVCAMRTLLLLLTSLPLRTASKNCKQAEV